LEKKPWLLLDVTTQDTHVAKLLL